MNYRHELLNELIESFIRAARGMHTGQGVPFGKFMLGRQQIMILFFIYENKGLASLKEIAKCLSVTPGAVTQFVDGLVEKKLVERKENINDRRVINVKLSLKTEKEFKLFRKKYLISVSHAFTDFNDEELKQFIKLLSKIKK